MMENPWAQIARPPEGLNLRRVDPAHPANFYWAKDRDGHYALVLTVPAGAANIDESRPDLNGIDIRDQSNPDGQHALILILRREEDAELFRHLCDDIVEACRSAGSEHSFLALTIRRAWKWHSLLRGAGRARLGLEEQQGLVGELLFLRKLAASLSPKAALEAWRGPLDEPKDFVFGNRGVEVKARHFTKSVVKISSEHQLQRQPDQHLFLLVHALAPSSPHDAGAFTLGSLVEEVRSALVATDPSAEEGFESRLLAAGYSVEHDYTDKCWMLASSSAYAVIDGFPRLEAQALPAGVASVSYWISMPSCASFETSEVTILDLEPR